MVVHKKNRRITLGDVAQHSGVSRATASLVVRNSRLISPETHRRVRKSMAALHYVYNQSAANLRTQRTKTLGMIIADVSNPFYAVLASGIENTCNERDYLTIFADTREDVNRQHRIIDRLIQHNVAGVLLCPAGNASERDLRLLEKVGIPVVQIMRYLKGHPASYIGPNNIRGAHLAINHLAGLGHKRIGIIGGPPHRSSSVDRLRGFREAMATNRIKVDDALVVTAEISRRSAMEAALHLLHRSQPPTAIFCYNDLMAFGVMLACMKEGLEPGKDLAVVGFDDIPESALWTPPLTTVAVDARSIGHLAASELLQRIDDPQRSKLDIIIEPRLVVRRSCGEH
jgi:LacI family transcriptional regulator